MSITRDEVIAWLERLTVVELDDLILELQQRLHLQPITPRQPFATMGAAPTMGAPIEDEFFVKLVDFGVNKVAVIKALREQSPTLGLMEAKKLVESAPVMLRESLYRHEAEALAEPLRRAGATVTVR
jgi:large subunit ribosomal protein L7/L12